MSHGHYDIRITPAARKELDRLPVQHRERVETVIVALADNPRPFGCLKLRGLENAYRLRVGNYRVLYRIYDNELVVLVVTIGDRKDIYRR
jgi:mRNA interferase RelE/StbE